MVKELGKLVAGLKDFTLTGNAQVLIKGIEADSRLAGPGTLFVAVKGTGGDGHKFLGQAVDQGCVTVVHEDPLDEHLTPEQQSKLEASIKMPRTRPAPALLARELADRPDADLVTAAVTGTNGKTTVAFLLQEMLKILNGSCGMLGTICYDDGNQSIPAPLTTPGGPILFQWLGQMVSGGCKSVAMELSSHALDQQRCAGLSLSVAVMTNIGRDHLDYHSDIPSYLQAKALIMDYLTTDAALVYNAADELLVNLDKGTHRVLGFDPRPGVRNSESVDLILINADLGLAGTKLQLDFRGSQHLLQSPLVGRFNVENLMAAFAAGLALGYDPNQVSDALAGVNQVPGRLERFVLPGGGLAVVDYAHTHDALGAVLNACDELSSGQLLVVFGCGGDRDTGKRPLMGKVAAQQADAVWITSDNPRTENPASICAEIARGYKEEQSPRSKKLEIIEDRTKAIQAALKTAGAGDIVVVAGKGHEDYQLVGDKVLNLDDRMIIKEWIGEQSHGD